MGKGSRYRPVDKKKYDKNFERIFGKGATGGHVCIGSDFAKDFKKAVKAKANETEKMS